MRKGLNRRWWLGLGILWLTGIGAFAQEPPALVLPPPQTSGGKPLMDALRLRQTGRAFSGQKLSPQTLSNLLWAASGVNRPESGKMTAPTARNLQEIDIYVALEEGLYLFEPRSHSLKPILAQDLRAAAGKQKFVGEAPVNLIYVADYGKMKMPPTEQDFYAACDTGFISQNVYLFCASEQLSTVVRGLVDRPTLAQAMGLRPEQHIVLAQTVGYPPKP